MALIDKRMTPFLYVAQGVGAVFVALFVGAYLGGLPSTAVLHSEPVFRIPLAVIGAVFLVLVISVLVVAFLAKKDGFSLKFVD
jgi:hypothetical protein